MEPNTITPVLQQYGFEHCQLEPLGTGLINHTWKVSCKDKTFVLQRINDQVFRNPEVVASNIHQVATYLQKQFPSYIFPAPLQSTSGEEMVHLPDLGFFRAFPFVSGTHTVDVVTSASQAYEAAAKFAEFTRLMAGFDAGKLSQTIPDFHNLELRFQQFQTSVNGGDTGRKSEAAELITFLNGQAGLVEQYRYVRSSPHFKTRVTHHDTKISNVLFNQEEKGVCVIDLDTVMPGYFISDLGDMMRTYLSPVDENERDLTLIHIRKEYFRAVVSGYLRYMHDELSAEEKLFIVYSGKFMIYMQALRFLADYLNNDIYYPIKYPKHNLVRAQNQVVLLQQLLKDEPEYHEMVTRVLDGLENK